MTTATGAAARIAERSEALAAAQRLARDWRQAGPARDRDRRLPIDELAALSRSGLLGISVPAEFGGAGLLPSVVAQVFAVLAGADVALTQIAQNHFDFVDVLRFADEPFRSELFAQVLDGSRFGNALAEAGSQGLRIIRTRLTPAPGGFTLNGHKQFATGALTADWVPVIAVDPSDAMRVVYVERHAPGVDIRDDWDSFGQRATFSGSAVFSEVPIAFKQVVERGRGNPTLAVALLAGNQLIHAAIEYGGASGSLAALNAVAGTAPGELAQALERARLAVQRAARLVDDAVAAGRPSRDGALRAFIAVDAAKAIAYRAGPRLGREVLASADVASVLASAGLDRHWRNARVHSLHDPARQRERDIGRYLLLGSAPAMATLIEKAD
jgi:alkylation response protein AidB-like acyl-CoA dehydrogenase